MQVPFPRDRVQRIDANGNAGVERLITVPARATVNLFETGLPEIAKQPCPLGIRLVLERSPYHCQVERESLAFTDDVGGIGLRQPLSMTGPAGQKPARLRISDDAHFLILSSHLPGKALVPGGIQKLRAAGASLNG